jgi:uncharacterized protein
METPAINAEFSAFTRTDERLQERCAPMATTHALDAVIQQYQTLCRYCDDVFAATFARFQSEMRCARGCASCCVLETVAPLEAFIIESYLHNAPNVGANRSADQLETDDSNCVFLRDNACAIYPVRPIICRTHGLPLLYEERQEIEVCPLNFTEVDLAALDPQFFLDAEAITDNLMRLNLAFSILTGTTERAGERVALRELRHQVTRNFIGA